MAEQATRTDEAGTEEKVKEKARETKQRAGSAASSAGAEARDLGREAVQEGREKAEELGEEAARRARSRAEEEKHRVADGVRTVAEALRQGSRDLPDDRGQYGEFLEGIADRVEGASRYLEEHDVDTLAAETARLARDHAPLVMGGAFTLGFAGARLLKASGGDRVPAVDGGARARAYAARGRAERGVTSRGESPRRIAGGMNGSGREPGGTP